MDRRQHRILDALFKALELQGAKVKQDERRALVVQPSGEPVEFQLREKQKQVRRSLTADEKRWHRPEEKDWKQELRPSGKLVLAIKTYLPAGLTTEWLETDERSLEALLPDTVATIVAAGPLLVECRRQREEDERRRREEEHRRYQEQQPRKREDNRWRQFVARADQRREAEVARGLLTSLRSEIVDLD